MQNLLRGRRVVATTRAQGYPVEYREFDGPHTVPQFIAEDAVQWFTATRPASAARS